MLHYMWNGMVLGSSVHNCSHMHQMRGCMNAGVAKLMEHSYARSILLLRD